MGPEITIEDIMEQAQVYASAWALVGSKFDQGNQLKAAKAEKQNLEVMLENFTDQVFSGAASGNMKEIAEGMIAWHQHRMKQLRTVLDQPADTEILIGSGADKIPLTGDVRKGFRMGMVVARDLFEKFPLQITRNEPAEED